MTGDSACNDVTYVSKERFEELLEMERNEKAEREKRYNQMDFIETMRKQGSISAPKTKWHTFFTGKIYCPTDEKPLARTIIDKDGNSELEKLNGNPVKYNCECGYVYPTFE